LLRQYVVSELAHAAYPTALFAWPTDSGPTASFTIANVPVPWPAMRRVEATARRSGRVEIEAVSGDTAVELVMAAPSGTTGVTTVVVAPKSRLFAFDPFGRLRGLEVESGVN